MKYKVNMTLSAEEDLFEIYRYVFTYDTEENSEKLYSKLYDKCMALSENHNKGRVPQELSLAGIDDFLEIAYNPYRIIYQVIGKEIFIHCIIDGRRDIQKQLQERLIKE